MKTIRLSLRVLVTGYMLFFYSELLFWARPRPGDSLINWLVTWLVYTLAGLAFLTAVAGFRVKSVWALFLCGALFGWLTEGIIVQTMYDAFPIQISWTGLAWHALISVMVGWLAVPLALRRDKGWLILGLAIVLGLFWGIWALWWWAEQPEQIASPGAFTAYALFSSLLLILAYWIDSRLSDQTFTPSKWLVAALGLFFGGLFLIGAAPAAPLAALVLPFLLGLVFLALWRSRSRETGGSLFEHPSITFPATNFILLLAMPLTAAGVYAISYATQIRLQAGPLIYLITTVLGFVLFGVSLVKTWRGKPDQARQRGEGAS